jgi:hypothetical protein
MINALIDECKRIFTILFIIWLCFLCLNLFGCATTTQTIPVVIQPEYPIFGVCSALPLPNEINDSNVADVISNIIANYRFCASEVDIAIKFKERMSK